MEEPQHISVKYFRTVHFFTTSTIVYVPLFFCTSVLLHFITTRQGLLVVLYRPCHCHNKCQIKLVSWLNYLLQLSQGLTSELAADNHLQDRQACNKPDLDR